MQRLWRSLIIGAILTSLTVAFSESLPTALLKPLWMIAIYGSALTGGNVHVGSLPFLVFTLLAAFTLVGYVLLPVSDFLARGNRWGARLIRAAGHLVCPILFVAAFRFADLWLRTEHESNPLVAFGLAYGVAGFLAGATWRSPAIALGSVFLSAIFGAWFFGPPPSLFLRPQHSGRAALADLLIRGGLAWTTGVLAAATAWALVRFGERAMSGRAAVTERRRGPGLLARSRTLLRTRWRELAVGVLVVLAFGTAAVELGVGSWLFPWSPPWQGARSFNDPVLASLFEPDGPGPSTSLFETTDNQALFVATLRETLPRDYERHYLDLLRSRGVFIRPEGGSAHAPAPIDSYRFLVIRPGVDSNRAVSIRYREFWADAQDEPDDSFWWPIARWRSRPSPVRKRGPSLWVSLGNARSAPWEETWPLPERDEVEGPELPLPRYPGSVTRDWGPDPEDRDFLNPHSLFDVGRLYAVRGAAPDEVVAHYEGALRDFGVTPHPNAGVSHGVEWWGKEPVKGIVRVAVSAGSPGLVWGRPLEPRDDQEAAERLLPGLEGVTEIRVSVRFQRFDEAVAFWPDTARRRRELLAGDGGGPRFPASPARIAPPMAVLRCGWAASTREFLTDVLHEAVRLVPPSRVSAGLLAEHRVLVIPSGGVSGMQDRGPLADGLRRFVNAGGVVIAFSQAEGSDFEVLPVPAGEYLRAIGSNVDQSVYAKGVRVDRAHPALASIVDGYSSLNVDGSFEEVPASSRVLLRKTKSDLPAVVAYPVGRGWVVATSIFDDCLPCARPGAGDPGLIRDLLAWAREPADLPWHAPGRELKLPVRVANRGISPSASVALRLLSPSRDRVLAEGKVPQVISPRSDAQLTWSFRLPDDAPRGIHHISFTLLDAAGGEVQPAVESPGDRVVVGAPPHPPSPLSDLGVTLRLPQGMSVDEGEPLAVEYRLENRLDRERRLRLYGGFTNGRTWPLGEHTIAPRGRLQGNFEARPRRGDRGCWLEVFEVNGSPKGTPMLAVPNEAAAFQLVEGVGIRVRPDR